MQKNIPLAIGTILALLGVGKVLYDLRDHPPVDFMIYYFAGRLVADGQVSRLYDKAAYEPLLNELRSRGEFISPINVSVNAFYFVRPVFAAYLYAPLARLPFRTASWVFVALNVGLLALLVWFLPKWFPFPDYFGAGLLRICLAFFPPFLAAIGYGQDILLLTLMAAGGTHLILQERGVAGGIVLALCGFKPHLVAAMPLALLAARKRRALCSFLGTGAVLAAISFLAVGWQGIRDWVYLVDPSLDYSPENMGNIRAVRLQWGLAAAGLVVVLALACFGIILRSGSLPGGIAGALLVSLLLSPHTYRYDFSLMTVCALLADRPVPRYLLLLPWLNFYPREDLLPMVLLALGYLVISTWNALRKDQAPRDARCGPAPPGD